MGKLKAFLLAFIATLPLLHLVHAQTQQGFISIDCGSNSSYTEPATGINYVSDSNYVETGLAITLPSSSHSETLLQQLRSLRSFPNGTRNCYNIQVKLGIKYLIRASFFYANYDAQNNIPEFDLYFGPDFWVTVNLGDNIKTIINNEIIHITTSNQVQICLVNSGNGVPFVSALELRPLPNTTYVTTTGSLSTFLRLDTGSPNDYLIRFPDDIYDRVWSPPAPLLKWTPINTSLPIANKDSFGFMAPSKVLSTASTVINASAPMEIFWDDDNGPNLYYVYMYFAELQLLKPNQSRLFKLYLNDDLLIKDDIVVAYLSENVVRTIIPSSFRDYKLIMSEGSTLPPILNAIEIYKVMNFTQLTTEQADVDAIESIKHNYGVTKNWQGDPCAPTTFVWQGLNCSHDASNPPRITRLDLSSSGLSGEILGNIASLAKLEVLDLSNNSLSGMVPDFLAKMPMLTVLNLSGNNLSGQIPAALIDKTNEGSLSLSTEGNPNLQGTTPSEEKKNNIVVPIAAAIGGAIIILLLILASVYFIRRKRSNSKAPIIVDPHSPMNSELQPRPHEPLHTPSRQLSYSDILKMTNNFSRLLGEGGFGKVYYGVMGNTEVAVKMLSPKSAQGYREFQAEVDLLLRVHHRNLTGLVGYCNEGETKMGLVYEYMAKGNLGSVLSDGRVVLRWEERLQIALDSAQGLEYLHNGCRPPIIHRDIKPSNILLNEYLQAKLADFGLSRAFPMEGGATHVTTKVVGTPGYLDPEYYTSYKLTEKSDVYSFGIVILELITGRPVLVKISEKSHIIQWVDSNITQGDIYSIIDFNIKEDCCTNSVWKAVDIGMSCTARNPINRPTMSQVVNELKECLSLELNQRDHQTDSATTISSTIHSEMGPVAR
ncbi:probable LRR receptor-like serine/threonine-protein kinase At1g51810 [Cucurbita pepo subsp. pepo]|uniref:probable LRR receptor-like serine/threonine-protein kinase At1g51810 n=1 Tax=Cucurbita pepo subsp. pepo TaxID=3664 RepID=UPI000C9D2EF2|nr:probable LRR receptor-like serine/threonine-protein kinase At1g51810 [Cucurbita pepo subsp. pepo]